MSGIQLPKTIPSLGTLRATDLQAGAYALRRMNTDPRQSSNLPVLKPRGDVLLGSPFSQRRPRRSVSCKTNLRITDIPPSQLIFIIPRRIAFRGSPFRPGAWKDPSKPGSWRTGVLFVVDGACTVQCMASYLKLLIPAMIQAPSLPCNDGPFGIGCCGNQRRSLRALILTHPETNFSGSAPPWSTRVHAASRPTVILGPVTTSLLCQCRG
ncbi:hypothetical protein OH76DRAFT_816686 [Lentinus brumalis]|uniref:Uncharacterized protein n=1 Tax=Lentinus brumalis TaxID=2498619 RepID=A0A371D2M8_9APHY|nr:hypothetical protein OH76DRAFT_816686 [Polyporus brumalis]